MITETEIYWITRMDYFQGAAIALGVLLSLASATFTVVAVAHWYEEKNSNMFKVAFPTLLACLTILIGSMFIPNTKEMCAIKILPVIINNEGVQELPNRVVDLANEWLEELKPSKGGE